MADKQFIKVSQLRDSMTLKPNHKDITDFFNGKKSKNITVAHIESMKKVIGRKIETLNNFLDREITKRNNLTNQ